MNVSAQTDTDSATYIQCQCHDQPAAGAAHAGEPKKPKTQERRDRVLGYIYICVSGLHPREVRREQGKKGKDQSSHKRDTEKKSDIDVQWQWQEQTDSTRANKTQENLALETN